MGNSGPNWGMNGIAPACPDGIDRLCYPLVSFASSPIGTSSSVPPTAGGAPREGIRDLQLAAQAGFRKPPVSVVRCLHVHHYHRPGAHGMCSLPVICITAARSPPSPLHYIIQSDRSTNPTLAISANRMFACHEPGPLPACRHDCLPGCVACCREVCISQSAQLWLICCCGRVQCGTGPGLQTAMELAKEMGVRRITMNCHAYSALMNGAPLGCLFDPARCGVPVV